MPFPTVIKRREQKAVQIIGQVCFKFSAGKRGLWNRLQENASVQANASRRRFRSGTSHQSVLNFTQKIMTDRAAHRMRRKILVRLDLERAIKVVRQSIFKFVTKHLFSFSNFRSAI